MIIQERGKERERESVRISKSAGITELSKLERQAFYDLEGLLDALDPDGADDLAVEAPQDR